MKKCFLLSSLALLISTSNAFADYTTYSLSYSANLYYRNKDGEILKMGSTDGRFVKQKNEKLKIETSTLYFISEGTVGPIENWSGCADSDPLDSPSVEAVLTKEIVAKIMWESVPSIWRSDKSENDTFVLINELYNDLGPVKISASFCARKHIEDEDHREVTLRYQGTNKAEGLKLIIRIGRSLSKTVEKEISPSENW